MVTLHEQPRDGDPIDAEPIADEGSLPQYVVLFCAVFALFVAQMALRESTFARSVLIVLGVIALLIAVELGQVRGLWRRVAYAVVVIGLVSIPVDILNDSSRPRVAFVLVNGLLVAGGPPAILAAIRRHPVVSVRTLLGAMTIYVLIGLFFAFVYRAIFIADPAAFTTSTGALHPATLQYLSFITLTTVGFGDVTATSDIARAIVALEAVIGQIYLVTVVALVVGNMGNAVVRRR